MGLLNFQETPWHLVHLFEGWKRYRRHAYFWRRNTIGIGTTPTSTSLSEAIIGTVPMLCFHAVV
jgi:hypothetical protein